MEPSGGPGPREDPESILRPLRAAGGALGPLRAGTLPPAGARDAIVQVAFAIENTLRRLLRDDPAAALPVRLRALAPDELRAEEVLSELRQHDRVSIELAALVHELLGLRGPLREGRPPQPADAALAVQTADRLEREVLDAPPAPDLVDAAVPDASAAEAWGEPAAAPPPERPVPVSGWIAGLVGLLLVLGLALWWNARGDTSEFDRGVALFRSGAYADAAAHFYRYAQANPDEVVPHLYLARIHRRMRRPELAADELRTAMRLAPEEPAVHRELGFLLLDTGRPAVAVERFRTAVTLDGDNQQAWIGLVRALREDGRADAAGRVLQQAPPEVRALLSSPRPAPSSPDAGPR